MGLYNCLTSFDKSTFFAADSSDAAIANTVRPVQHKVGALDLFFSTVFSTDHIQASLGEKTIQGCPWAPLLCLDAREQLLINDEAAGVAARKEGDL